MIRVCLLLFAVVDVAEEKHVVPGGTQRIRIRLYVMFAVVEKTTENTEEHREHS
jgi:hypothetical protein